MVEILNEVRKDPNPGQEEIFVDIDKLMVEFGAVVETFDSLWKGKVSAREEASSEVRRAMAEGINTIEGIET